MHARRPQGDPPLLGRFGVRSTPAVSTIGTGAGIAVMVAGTTSGGGFWTLLPGSIVWRQFGGVAPHEQGVASELASTAKEGGAMGQEPPDEHHRSDPGRVLFTWRLGAAATGCVAGRPILLPGTGLSAHDEPSPGTNGRISNCGQL